MPSVARRMPATESSGRYRYHCGCRYSSDLGVRREFTIQGIKPWAWGLRFGISVVLLGALAGCASQTRSVVDGLDVKDPAYTQEACQQSRALADTYDDIKVTRTIGSPLILVMAGPAAFLPVLAANVGLDTLDHLDASHVSVVCGGFETPTYNMMERVFLGLGLNVLTQGIRAPGN